MSISLKHKFASLIPDAGDPTIVQPSNWNDEHALTQATSTILGRVTAGTGVTEELTPAQARTLLNVADGATANSSDAFLLARANHTGTESADVLTDGTTNKAFLATERTKLAGIAAGATANSSDAFLLARANHTGTQLAATISDFSTAADLRIAAAAATGTGSLVRANNATVSGTFTLGQDPATALEAATKQYVDNLAAVLDVKPSARAATTANITLSAPQTIDGVSVIAGDRVLVKDQATPAQNGIYVVAAGAWTRATDMDAWAEVPGANVWVEEGTTNADRAWVCTANVGGTIGTTAITWSQFGGTGAFQAASANLTSWAAITRAPGYDTFAATPTSANLAAAVTDETGTGALVFATSPTLVTPALGTPTALILTNATGLPVGSLTGLGTGVGAFLATPSSANLAAALTDETGSGANVFANTPTLVTPILGDATASSISMSGGGGVSHTFTGSGLAANIWVNQSSAALSNTVPEIGAQFTMTSNTGFANSTTAYKMAATFSVVATAASSSIYGTNTIMQGYGGAGGYLITGNEVDINNLGATAATLAASTAVYGFVGVASGAFNSTAAFSATGSGADWTYGFATWLNGVKAVSHSDFRAQSTATNILTATGARTNGVDLSGATFSNHAFESPGFYVGGNGTVVMLGTQISGSTAIAGPSMFQSSNILTFAGGTSGFQWDNQALGAQLMSLSNTGAFNVIGPITSSNASGGVGYAVGAGGTVTQATSKSTTVALAKMCGNITMNAAALAAGTIVTFQLTNAAISGSDVLVLNHIFGGTIGAYTLNAQCGAGSAQINVRNNTAGSLSDAIVIQFAVVKAVNS